MAECVRAFAWNTALATASAFVRPGAKLCSTRQLREIRGQGFARHLFEREMALDMRTRASRDRFARGGAQGQRDLQCAGERLRIAGGNAPAGSSFGRRLRGRQYGLGNGAAIGYD